MHPRKSKNGAEASQRDWAGTHLTRQTRLRGNANSRVSCTAAHRNEAAVSETSHTWMTSNPTRSLQLPQDVSKAYLPDHEVTSRQTDSADGPCPPRNNSTLGNSEGSVMNHATILFSFHKTAKPTPVEKTWSQNYEMPQMSTSHSSYSDSKHQ